MRCEGWTRSGGAFTLGPVIWTQCENEAEVILTVFQDGQESRQPACISCWRKANDENIPIRSAEVIYKTSEEPDALAENTTE